MHDEVGETVVEPDMIKAGDFGELLALRHYRQTSLTSKFLVVAYREIGLDNGFVLTADLARRPSTRRTIVCTRQRS